MRKLPLPLIFTILSIIVIVVINLSLPHVGSESSSISPKNSSTLLGRLRFWADCWSEPPVLYYRFNTSSVCLDNGTIIMTCRYRRCMSLISIYASNLTFFIARLRLVNAVLIIHLIYSNGMIINVKEHVKHSIIMIILRRCDDKLRLCLNDYCRMFPRASKLYWVNIILLLDRSSRCVVEHTVIMYSG